VLAAVGAVVVVGLLAIRQGGRSSVARDMSDAELADVVDCTGSCELAGTVPLDHPTWGDSVFVASEQDGDTELAVVDADGEVVWDRTLELWYVLSDPEVDDLGHVFVEFTSGAGGTAGVMVFAPENDGLDDFGSLPDGEARFFGYNGDGVQDVDGDGTFEILVGSNDCIPDCAGGTVVNTTYEWDGEDYVEA